MCTETSLLRRYYCPDKKLHGPYENTAVLANSDKNYISLIGGYIHHPSFVTE